MKNLSYRNLFILICSAICIPFFLYSQTSQPPKPRLTVIIVVDQFAYHYLRHYSSFFKGGLRMLLNKGLVYENALYPHANPSTAPGHTTINTGVYPKDHGIIGNSWFDDDGNEIESDDDPNPSAQVFIDENNTYSFTKSGYNIRVDGLSDQFMLHAPSQPHRYAIALSLKSRAAIGMAGKSGKTQAIWLDPVTGKFTSSKAYFSQLPAWLTEFNKEHDLRKQIWKWDLFFNKKHAAYKVSGLVNHDPSVTFERPTLIGKKVTYKYAQAHAEQNEEEPFELYARLPQANQLLLDLAKRCIITHFNKRQESDLLLWISLSSLDKVGHEYGPHSLEALDMVYWLDDQIGNFIRSVQRRSRKSETLFIFTADHGIEPTPEYLHHQGFKSAGRLSTHEHINTLNRIIGTQYGLSNLILNFKSPQFFLNMQQFKALDYQQQEAIVATIKEYLLSIEGVERVWTYPELAQANLPANSLESLFQLQLFEGRSGYITCQTAPYYTFTSYPSGAAHITPYEFNRHVPLILFQKGICEQKRIVPEVSMVQLPNTLAHILGIARPSASTAPILPGIISAEEK